MRGRLAGLDVNGWRDTAVRSWERADLDADIASDARIDGGRASSVVRVGDGDSAVWTGGAQADLAPHGRGGGWGDVGASDRRVPVADLMARITHDTKPWHDEELLAAVVRGLAPGADIAVLAIPDGTGFGEGAQERALGALKAAGVRRPLLAWRPVLAALLAIEDGVDEGARIGVVSHCAEGLTCQSLVVRRRSEDRVAAPQRLGEAILTSPAWGLSALEATSRAAVLATNPVVDRLDRVIDRARLPALAAMGESPEAEVLRLDNGAWIELRPRPPSPPPLRLHAERFGGCDKVLLETVVEGEVREALVRAVEGILGVPVAALPPDAVARGARIAAGRLSRGEPIYFDVLPQMRTIVLDGHEPASQDLIDSTELLPAGRTYRTPRPIRFGWPASREALDIYLDRDGSGGPRRSRIAVDDGPSSNRTVELILEQAPAAGPARLTVSARDWPSLRDHPRTILFDQAEVDGRTWEEIIDDLRRPPPAYPDRMVLPCGLGPWFGTRDAWGARPGGGLAELLRRDPPDWKALADTIAKTARDWPSGPSEYAVDSDGALPVEIEADPDITRLLTLRCWEAASTVFRHARERNEVPDNDRLRFLTWTFRMCPGPVVDEVIAAIRASRHPFNRRGAATSLHHALGRVAEKGRLKEAADILRAFPALHEWKEYHVACAAFLLSRNDEIFNHLTRGDVDRMAEVVEASLIRPDLRRRQLTYTSTLLGGLLRWRTKEQFALVPGEDDWGDRLHGALDAALERGRVAGLSDGLLVTLEDLRGQLEGRGGRPDILAALIMAD